MKLDRWLALLAVAMSAAALGVSMAQTRRDPLGTDISKYDLSSPEKTLRSINSMASRQDLRAAWQLVRGMLESDTDPGTKLIFSEGAEISVLKSTEVSSSANAANKGLVVSFVKFTVAGVEYRTVQYFRRDQLNRFRPAESFYVPPYGTEKSEEDKALEAAIEAFKKTGKI